MATRGRPPGQGKVPGSGRKKGSLDRSARMLISEQVAFDILKTYRKLGPDWLFKIAQERPDLFINQCLSKILPPAFKEDPDTVNSFTQINNLSDRDAAVRVAFALSTALYGDPSVTTEPATIEAERVPDEPPRRIYQGVPWRAPADAPDMLPPEPMTPQEAEWAASLPLSPQERQDQKLIRQTKEASIVNYAGSSAEQGSGAARSRPAERVDPRSEQRSRMLARRNELL